MNAITLQKNRKQKIVEDVEFAPLEAADLAELSEMISAMRPYSTDLVRLRDFSENYFHWMYFRNPAGRAITWGGKHDGRLVCSFAMAPKKMHIDSQTVTIGKTMEMFTHPDYQGLGLVSQAVKKVFSEARAQGITTWYVTPSKNSYPIFLDKWGYKEPFENHYVIKVLNLSSLLSAMMRPAWLGACAGAPLDLLLKASRLFTPLPKGYEVHEEKSFDSETDALWERSKGNRLALVRDAAYMNWRYVDNPDSYRVLTFRRRGSLDGILVLKHTLRRGKKAGDIVDFLCPAEDNDTLQAMLRHGIDRLRRDGC
ncbi:MAG: GNAT family N-acetyltransferase, partial [Planctomycetota bacterium]